MKKNTRSSASSANKRGKPSQTTRHTKTAKKPVTIDLTAEKVPQTSATGSSSPKTSVPKSSASAAKAKSDTKSGNAATTKPTGFSRQDAKAEASKSSKPTANPADASKPDSKSPQPPRPEAGPSINKASGGGIAGKLAAAVIGGFVALTSAGLLQYVGVLSTPGISADDYVSAGTLNSARNDLAAKIATLEAQLKESSDASPDMDAVNTAIKQSVEAQLKQAASVGGSSDDAIVLQLNETTTRVEALQKDLAGTNQTIQELRSAIASGAAGEDAGLATISSRLDDVSSRIDSFSTELSALTNTTTELSSRKVPAPADNSKTLAAIAAVQASVPALKQNLSDQLKSLDQRIAGMEEKSSVLSSITKQVAQLEEQTGDSRSAIAALQERATNGADKQAARSIAAAAVKSDIDRGVPFAGSLETLKAVTGDSQQLTELAAYADAGVPTVAQLASDYEAVSEAIIIAVTPKPKDDLASRLLAGAKSMVKIKPILPETGSTPLAIVSQLENSIKTGDLEKASGLWETLPDSGKSVSEDWHKGIKARIAANALVANSIQSFLLSSGG